MPKTFTIVDFYAKFTFHVDVKVVLIDKALSEIDKDFLFQCNKL